MVEKRSIAEFLASRFNPWGPTITPASINPMMPGILTLLNSRGARRMINKITAKTSTELWNGVWNICCKFSSTLFISKNSFNSGWLKDFQNYAFNATISTLNIILFLINLMLKIWNGTTNQWGDVPHPNEETLLTLMKRRSIIAGNILHKLTFNQKKVILLKMKGIYIKFFNLKKFRWVKICLVIKF